MVGHRSSYRKGKKMCTSRRVLEAGDAIIVLEEAVPCNNKEELKAHEARYIRDNQCVNKQVPGRTKAEYMREYKQVNREAINAKNREYKQVNKEVLNAKQREKINCPCGSTHTRSNKATHQKTLKHQAWLAQQQQQ
jgi:hypothetical protein